jgi:coproporphyrinogen III oxidase
MKSFKIPFVSFIREQQDLWCSAIEEIDQKAVFQEDFWNREGGGGGRSRVLSKGKIFEKAGINISEIHGQVSETMSSFFKENHSSFFACGISLVIHPQNPFIPTVHANYRYFELYDSQGNVVDYWFGGGSDLTPYYLFEEDGFHFHGILKSVCDQFDSNYYPTFKKACDDYFYNHHRNEARGIGGLFFEHLNQKKGKSGIDYFNFTTSMGQQFLNSYLPIVQKRKNTTYQKKHKYWQELRRGRYVEFNLIHDLGTHFGLKSNGRIESIFMSLPPTVRWDYSPVVDPNSPEQHLLDVLKNPTSWITPFNTVQEY